MKECVFFEADVNKHRLQAHLDVFDSALVNAADDIPRALTLDAVFLKPAVLEQRNARLEFFYTEYELVPRLAGAKPQNLSYLVYHKIEEVERSAAVSR